MSFHQQFLDLSSDLHSILNADGSFEYRNPAWAEALGYADADIQSKTLWDIVHPEDHAITREVLRLPQSQPRIFENRCLTHNGTPKIFSWKVKFTGGKIYATAREITEFHRNMEQLKRSQTFLDSIIENIPNMIFIKDAKDLKFIHFNRAGEELIGFSRDAFIGKSDYDFFPKDQADFFTSKDREVIRSGKIADIAEEPIQTRDKGTRVLHTKKLGMTAPDGSQYLIGIAEDITEKKEFADALKLSEERFRTLYENAPILIDAFDENGRCILWNKACENTLGYRLDELNLKKDLLSTFYPDPKVRTEVLETIKNPDGKFREFKVRHRDGRDVYQMWANFALPKKGVICIGIDINDRKLAEQELIRARQLAEEATRIKSEFLANMSHEIRTPINGVIGMTGFLLETTLTDEQRDYAETVKRSADSLLTVINDILDFSKVEAGKLEIEEGDFDFSQLIQDTIKTLSFASREKGVPIFLENEFSFAHNFRGDSGRIQQILINLLSNAVKFTSKGQVRLRIFEETRSATHALLKVEVEDSGIGISASAQQRLFKAFSQADSTTSRRFGGTGLGLSISKHLVELMGGKIGVKSAEGKGSTFWFTLPLKISDSVLTSKSKDKAPTQEINVSGIRILVAEDNSVNQKVALKQLEKLGYQATVVANGAEAIAALNSENFDLILMDCQMPEMDGFQATQVIRTGATKNSARIPIVAMTANAMFGDREKCLSAGMSDYISKPVRLEELDRVLRSCLFKPEGARTSISA